MVLDVVAIKNDFFGADVTVAGLITGADLLQQLRDKDLGQGILIPDVVLKDGGELFLDGLTIEDIRSSLQESVLVVENSPWGVLDGLESLADDPIEVIHV